MRQFLKCIMAKVAICGVLYAEFPRDPDFSLESHILREPSALLQEYTGVPDSWESYITRGTKQEASIFTASMIMEICAIVDATFYIYPTKETLMQGCHRGDSGLLHLILQPYQYLPSLHTLVTARLMPSTRHSYMYPKVVIYYKSGEHTHTFFKSVELGDFYDKNSSIIIDGGVFQYDYDIMLTFYKLIDDIKDSMYLPENLYVKYYNMR